MGELTGYMLGYSGRSLLPTNGWYPSVERGVKQYGTGLIFVASIIPNPFFDAMGVIAGATRLPLPLFMLACFVGKTIRFWILATYGGRVFDCLQTLADVRGRLPTVTQTVVIGHGKKSPGVPFWDWDGWLETPGDDVPLERFPFNHPLYILYSSGTTGAPKAIVHGAGGTLLQHLKEHQIQCDVGRGDCVLYFTTTGWMMWHWLVSALATGATIWRTNLALRVFNAGVIVHGDTVWALSVDGKLVGVRLADGARQGWLQHSLVYTFSRPAVTGGVLAVGDQNGVLHGIRLP